MGHGRQTAKGLIYNSGHSPAKAGSSTCRAPLRNTWEFVRDKASCAAVLSSDEELTKERERHEQPTSRLILIPLWRGVARVRY